MCHKNEEELEECKISTSFRRSAIEPKPENNLNLLLILRKAELYYYYVIFKKKIVQVKKKNSLLTAM